MSAQSIPRTDSPDIVQKLIDAAEQYAYANTNRDPESQSKYLRALAESAHKLRARLNLDEVMKRALELAVADMREYLLGHHHIPSALIVDFDATVQRYMARAARQIEHTIVDSTGRPQQ